MKKPLISLTVLIGVLILSACFKNALAVTTFIPTNTSINATFGTPVVNATTNTVTTNTAVTPTSTPVTQPTVTPTPAPASTRLTWLCAMPAGEAFVNMSYDSTGNYFLVTDKNIYKCG